MSNGEGEGKRRPPSAAEVSRWYEEDLARRQRKKSKIPKPPEIDEHWDLGKTIAAERRRKGNHPAGHGRKGLPTGFSTTGSASQKPGSGSVE